MGWPARGCSAWLRLTHTKLWSLNRNKYLRLLRCIRILSNLLHICYITSLLLSPYSDTWYAKSYFVPLLCNTSVVSVIVGVKGGSPSFIHIIIHYQNNIAHLELLNKQKNLPRALMPLLMPCFHNYHKAELEIKPISSIRDQKLWKKLLVYVLIVLWLICAIQPLLPAISNTNTGISILALTLVSFQNTSNNMLCFTLVKVLFHQNIKRKEWRGY